MDSLMTVSLLGQEITVYTLFAAAFCLVCAGWTMARGPRYCVKRGAACLYALLAAALGLLLGRAIYCAVRWEWLFLDEMGDFAGLGAFFDTANGGVSVIGVMVGCLLAAPLAGLLTKNKAANLLDAAALPAVTLFASLRYIEPMAGQGYGDLVLNPSLCFFPIALRNDMGDYSLSVCFIESVLAFLVLAALAFAQKRVRKSGSLSLYALTLLCATQVMPDSLRRDDVLFLFIFARVSQIGYAVLLSGALAFALARGRKAGLTMGKIILESALMLCGVALCIGAEFALDKTNLPNALVYAWMIAALAGMAYLICRRVHKEDLRS